MRTHHEQAVQKLAGHFARQDGYLAVIIGGSVAKGVEAEFADIDAMLVVTDDLLNQLSREKRLTYFSTVFCDYPGGYVDAKIVNMAYLRSAAERGNEPTRAAFSGAFAAYSSSPEADDLLAGCSKSSLIPPPTPPEEEKSNLGDTPRPPSKGLCASVLPVFQHPSGANFGLRDRREGGEDPWFLRPVRCRALVPE